MRDTRGFQCLRYISLAIMVLIFTGCEGGITIGNGEHSPGDINKDGVVNEFDRAALARISGDPCEMKPEAATCQTADLNQDGTFNQADLAATNGELLLESAASSCDIGLDGVNRE